MYLLGENPLISVVVPNLNEAKYLRKFLDSLVYQSFRDFEVIIIDGGSTDGSLLICQEFTQQFRGFTVIVDSTRNIGFIRNLGASKAKGSILFHTSSDVIFDVWLLEKVAASFVENQRLIALTGRTRPVSDKLLCHLSYQGFDLLRWIFTKLPVPLRKYRPGGNFLVIRKSVFDVLLGFPEVPINEDGLLGQKLDLFLMQLAHDSQVTFNLGLCVHHHVKRFEEQGSLKTILFYLYVLANMFPLLKPFLYGVEARSGEIFKNRSDLRQFSGRTS